MCPPCVFAFTIVVLDVVRHPTPHRSQDANINISYSNMCKDIKANFSFARNLPGGGKTNIKVIDIEKAIKAAFESHLSPGSDAESAPRGRGCRCEALICCWSLMGLEVAFCALVCGAESKTSSHNLLENKEVFRDAVQRRPFVSHGSHHHDLSSRTTLVGPSKARCMVRKWN